MNTGPAVAMEVRLLTYLSPGLPQSLLKAQADPLTRLELEAFGLERFVAVDEEDYDAERPFDGPDAALGGGHRGVHRAVGMAVAMPVLPVVVPVFFAAVVPHGRDSTPDAGYSPPSPNAEPLKQPSLDRGHRACYSHHNVSTDVGAYTVGQDRCDLICIDAPHAEAIRARLLDECSAHEAAERAKALSDPTRLTLAAALGEGGELCVCDLSWIAGRSQNLVSHHLGVLRSRGLVRSRKDGKMVMYSLTPAGSSLLGAVAGEPTRERA